MEEDENSSRTWQTIARELSVEKNNDKVLELAEELNDAIKTSRATAALHVERPSDPPGLPVALTQSSDCRQFSP